PRYELKAGGSVERAEKVVPIRDQPTALKADVLPIRPARIQAGNDEDLTPAEMVQGLSHVLNPASTVLLALGLWRLGSDLGLTSAFVITDGPFSHWQVWIAAAGGLQAIGLALRKRFAASPERSSALD
ncbi:MAG TPA: hypothetical protein PKJ41_07560, partial [Bryobacteraceae bacterium]|nr:hypothetical protein [Bryobacteraceae bacterium]